MTTSDSITPDHPGTAALPFLLPDALTIHTVEAVAAQLQQVAIAPYQVTLDASRVEVLSTAGVQLLLSLEKTLQQAGGAMTLRHASGSVTDTFHQLGLSAHLSQWSAPHD